MKCSVCNGTGLVGIGPGIRGLKRCEACYGTGVVERGRRGSWEAHYICSCCGETVRKVVAECPFCHACMDGGDLVGSANKKCDWCKRNSVCRGVARSECIVRDYRDFVQEDTPAKAPIVYEPINGLIQELRYHARHSKNGKMGEGCVVPKALLADAADKLEEILKRCSI